jgi:phage/plasmid-like protein (TIGR03299 family)
MSHEIEEKQIAYAEAEVPWHGIGAPMKKNQSVDRWLKAANLDWEVVNVPVFGRTADGIEIESGNRSMFVRGDTIKDERPMVLTYASDTWTPLQNRDALNFMDRYVRSGDAELETIGALRGGKVVWGLAKMKHEFEVRKGDRVGGYLLIVSPHEAGSSIKVQTTTVRVVCANTMAASNAVADTHYTQSHRTEFDFGRAADAIAAAHEDLFEMEKRCKVLDKLKLTMADAFEKVIIPVFEPNLEQERVKEAADPTSITKKLEAIAESVQLAPGAIPETGWGILNGVTHYIDHVHGRSQETRFNSGQFGWGRNAKLKVEAKLLELAS